MRNLFEKYFKVTKKEKNEHLIQVSGLTNEEVKEKIDTLIKEFASYKKDKKSDKEIMKKLKDLSSEWESSNHKNEFYLTLCNICMGTESLEDILEELFEIKSACVQMQAKQNQKT